MITKKAMHEILWTSLALILLILISYLGGNITGLVVLNETNQTFGILPINETAENLTIPEEIITNITNITEPIFEIPELNITENITIPEINITKNITLPIILENITFKLIIKDKEKTLKEITLKNKTYETLEIIPGKIVSKIEFKNLIINQDLEFGLTEITKGIIPPKGIEFKKIYAIDISNLDFDNATITTKAISSKLFKCKYFDINLSICLENWKEILNLTKNQEYSFTINKTDPGFAEGEESKIMFGALDATIPPSINFTAPTPINNTITSNTSFIFNISLENASDLSQFIWDWNETNYTFYNDSLVLMFNFDNVSAIGENATYAVDVSKYSNNGTLINGVAWITFGKYGRALQFDGVNDYVNVSDSASLDIANEITILAWIKHNSTTGEQNIVSRNSGYRFRTTNGVLEGVVENTSGTFSNPQSGTLTLASNTWYHVAMVYNGSVIKTYINSVEDDSVNYGGTLKAGTLFEIGAVPIGGAISFFNGTIDEVRIWNRTLTADEINRSYYSNLRKYDTDKWSFYTNQSDLTDGAYTYYGCAKDISGNENCTETRTLTIDLNAPNISLISPSNNTDNSTTNDVQFNFNTTETGSCSLYIDYIWNTSISSTANITLNVSAINFAVGDYWWNVNCTDANKNNKSSELWNFSVSYLDVAPVVNTVHLSPTISYTNTTNLNCIFNISDLDVTDTLTWNITWWNSTTKYNLDNQTNATLASDLNNKNYSTNTTGALEATDIAKWELWKCEVWVNDGTSYATKNSSTINITNLPPDLKENIPNQQWQQDSSTTINLSNYFNDTDQDDLDYAIQSSPPNIGVSINNNTGIATLTPSTGWYGTSYIMFNVTDATDWTNSNNITLTITKIEVGEGERGGRQPPKEEEKPPEKEEKPPKEEIIPEEEIPLEVEVPEFAKEYYNQLDKLTIEGYHKGNCTYIKIDSTLIKFCIKDGKPYLNINFELPKGKKTELPIKINYNLIIFLLILILLAILFFKRKKRKKKLEKSEKELIKPIKEIEKVEEFVIKEEIIEKDVNEELTKIRELLKKNNYKEAKEILSKISGGMRNEK